MDANSLLQSILQNQVVTGLSVTAVLGGAMYQLRSVPRLLWAGTLRFFTVELTVLSNDLAYDWLDRWLAEHPYSEKTKMMRLRMIDADDGARPGEHEWALSPGPGKHLFWWRGRPVLLERTILTKEAVDGRVAKPVEQMHLRTLGRSQATIRALIADARTLATDRDRVTVRIWTEYLWERVRGKRVRPFDTLVLKPGQVDRIIADLAWFREAATWYAQRGIPYRRGYLFSGPPGTGKTSVVLALAGYLQRTICVLNLGAMSGDAALFEAIREAPLDALILLEDIDCAYPATLHEAPSGETATSISKAALLNAIDGITTPDGRIFIMTTNYPDRLDPALVRPGRADVHETFEYLDAARQCSMASRFAVERFEPLPFAVSPADMQAAFMQHPDDPGAVHDFLRAKFVSQCS